MNDVPIAGFVMDAADEARAHAEHRLAKARA